MKKQILLIIIISLVLSTACMNRPKRGSIKIEEKDESPETLISVEEGIDEILTSMTDIEEILKLSESELQVEKGKTESKKDETEDEGDKKDTEKKENGEKDNQKDKTTKPLLKDEELAKRWNEIDTKMEKIHGDWNDYEVESMKKGGNPEKGKTFKKNLNSFTIGVENRNIPKIMDMGSKTINSLASFFDLYKDEIRGDLSRIKYAAHQAYLNAAKGNVSNANKLLNSTEDYVTRLRQKLDKDKAKEKTLDKLSLAIADMKQSLNEKSIKLLVIKRDIILENIKALEK